MVRSILLLLLTGPFIQSVCGQQLGTLSESFPAPSGFVRYIADPQVVTAGKKGTIELRFQVRDGFHVNSHTPKGDLLLPTALLVLSADGLRAEEPQYPAGSEYSFSFDPKEKLNVYTGSFTIKLAVNASSGGHRIDATLKYQACDQVACYPPKSLPLSAVIMAR